MSTALCVRTSWGPAEFLAQPEERQIGVLTPAAQGVGQVFSATGNSLTQVGDRQQCVAQYRVKAAEFPA